MDSNIPDEVKKVLYEMQFAHLYNKVTGSSVTHLDIREWGIRDEWLVSLAIELW